MAGGDDVLPHDTIDGERGTNGVPVPDAEDALEDIIRQNHRDFLLVEGRPPVRVVRTSASKARQVPAFWSRSSRYSSVTGIVVASRQERQIVQS